MDHRQEHQIERVSIALSDLCCVGCAEGIEHFVRSLPHVASARLDFQRDRLTVDFHAGMTSEEDIRRAVDNDGRCTCAGDHVMPPAENLARRAEMAPITMGTKHDRMQYEMDASVHRAHGMATLPAPEHEAMDHGAHGAMAPQRHAGMDHSAADPAMARAMERDMRDRFFVSLVLTIPTVLYSPLGSDFLGIDMPVGPLRRTGSLLILIPRSCSGVAGSSSPARSARCDTAP